MIRCVRVTVSTQLALSSVNKAVITEEEESACIKLHYLCWILYSITETVFQILRNSITVAHVCSVFVSLYICLQWVVGHVVPR